jgi:hypothetical protein
MLNALRMLEALSPATPVAGRRLLYPKSDGWYEKNSAGVETKVGPSKAIAGVLTNNNVATTETVVAAFSIPANYMKAGDALNIEYRGQVSSTATLTYRVRIGTTGTTADALAANFNVTAAAAANAHTRLNAILHCLTAGAAGTASAYGQTQLASGATGLANAAFAAASVNTTVPNIVAVTVVQSAVQTLTSRFAMLGKWEV